MLREEAEKDMEKIRPSILLRPQRLYSRKNEETADAEEARAKARLSALKRNRQLAERSILESIRPGGYSPATKEAKRKEARETIAAREIALKQERTKHHRRGKEPQEASEQQENVDPRAKATRAFSVKIRQQNEKLIKYRSSLKSDARKQELEEDRARLAQGGFNARFGTSLQ